MLTDNFLNNDFRKKLILSNETTLRTLPFAKISLKWSGPLISEEILRFIKSKVGMKKNPQKIPKKKTLNKTH